MPKSYKWGWIGNLWMLWALLCGANNWYKGETNMGMPFLKKYTFAWQSKSIHNSAHCTVNVESRSYSKITQALMAVLLSARNGETLSSLGPELASRCGISKRYAPFNRPTYSTCPMIGTPGSFCFRGWRGVWSALVSSSLCLQRNPGAAGWAETPFISHCLILKHLKELYHHSGGVPHSPLALHLQAALPRTSAW